MQIISLTSKHYSLWDEYVKKHNQASPYHLLAYKNTLETTYKLTCPYLLAIENDSVVGVLPIAIFKTIFGKKSYCSLPYCDIGGALTNSRKITNKLLSSAEKQMAEQNIKQWQLRDSASLPLKPEAEIIEGSKVRMILALPDSRDELWSGFKAKVRSQVRKAEKNKLTCEVNQDSSLSEFYDVYCKNMRALGSPVHTFTWFEGINNHYQKNVHIVIVKLNEQAIAGGMIINSKQVCSVPWASSLREFNHTNANMLLYFNMLNIAIEQGCNYFDFGRSSFGQNTFKFKKQWGAQALPLAWQTRPYSNISNPAATLSTYRNIIAKLWSFLPLAATNYIGSKVRRYISL
ncbi:GNAT family N-acetyltransferase [Thalassomonas sp. M1454]|uniref:GNAT family N-acetyltransferase n=1 Tax=Thalassomonas sp. M1454 TaxID=2594477 RepID=UPI00118086D7|nr:GNAT family N-acetyltransferase [Thalassomonas sp. M1454]TRX57929.1 peptidoglycan bridge formation glycyltransferase FemA/FemB family protein [Thalassomonas sp. M1454]